MFFFYLTLLFDEVVLVSHLTAKIKIVGMSEKNWWQLGTWVRCLPLKGMAYVCLLGQKDHTSNCRIYNMMKSYAQKLSK